MTPVELLQRAKELIAADPDFTMSRWDRCIACKVCNAAGYTVDAETVVELNGRFVGAVANELIPGSPDALLFTNYRPSEHDNKEVTYKIIDDFIAKYYPVQVQEPAPELVTELIEEPVEELVCV